VKGEGDNIAIGAGVKDLVILKSSRSGFAGFLRDEYTTLPDVADRILATAMTATWRYRTTDLDFNLAWRAVRTTLLETFAEHDSRSVQHTLHDMARAVLDNVDVVSAVRLVMPNKHHMPVDLARLGLENRNEIFVPTDEPYGLIEATVTR
jgi:urate oxidase